MPAPVNSMSASWCATRREEVRAYLNMPGAPDPDRAQWRTWLIELLSQLDAPPASAAAPGGDIQLLTPEQRAELRRLAEAAIAALHEDYPEDDPSSWFEAGVFPSYWPPVVGEFMAIASPALALGTLTYIERLEAEKAELAARLQRLMEPKILPSRIENQQRAKDVLAEVFAYLLDESGPTSLAQSFDEARKELYDQLAAAEGDAFRRLLNLKELAARAATLEAEAAGLRERAFYCEISLGVLPAEDETVLLYKGPLTNMWPVRGQLKSAAHEPYWMVEGLPYILENYHGWAYPAYCRAPVAAAPPREPQGQEGGQQEEQEEVCQCAVAIWQLNDENLTICTRCGLPVD